MVAVLHTLVLISLIFALAYAGLQMYFVRKWNKTPDFLPLTPETGIVPVRISILVPARNEAHNLPALLHSILQENNTSIFLEIIVLDDFSEDKTVALAASFPLVKVIKMSDVLPSARRLLPNKKAALTIGVAAASGDVIVTTDADCIVTEKWLPLIGSAFAHDPKLQALSGPVAFGAGSTLLHRFQALDFSGMMGITGAGYFSGKFFMANGANFAYRKSAFEAVAGYEGNLHIASGDDMFLMQKMAQRFPNGVGFLKHPEAIVTTQAAADWPSFWQQRLRWGSKNAALPNGPLLMALAVSFLHCWLLVLLLIYACWSGNRTVWLILFLELVLKAWSDYRLLASLCSWFGYKQLIRWFWPSFFLHILYIISIGTASLFFKNYTWKGRKG